MKNYDIIIIGAGPAGISAGIYALRAGMKTLVFDHNNSMLEKTKSIENYYGFEKISGKQLKENGISQYKKLGGEIMFKEVVSIKKDFTLNIFETKTIDSSFSSKAIILCTGSEKKKSLDILEKYEGENLSYCAICDGFFYRDKTVAIIGDGNFALSESQELAEIAKKVYLITNTNLNIISKNPKVETINKEIAKVYGAKKLEKIEFKDGESLNIDGVFVALGTLSTFEIAKQLGILTKNNFVLVDKNFMTNIDGVFAAGDIVGGLLQIVKAASDGAQAGLEATRYIKIMSVE